jgi:DNA-binding Lrp family transcriptional regulator
MTYIDRPNSDIDKLLNLNPNRVVDYIHRLEEERDRFAALVEAADLSLEAMLDTMATHVEAAHMETAYNALRAALKAVKEAR